MNIVPSSRKAWDKFSLASYGWVLKLLSHYYWISFLTSPILPLIHLPKNDSTGILLCLEFCLILSTIPILQKKWSTCCSSFLMLIVSCYSIYTLHFWCCHYVWLFIYEKFSWYSHLVFNCCKDNHFSNYFSCNFSNCYDAPLVLHISTCP